MKADGYADAGGTHDRRVTQSLEAATSVVHLLLCGNCSWRLDRYWSASQRPATGTAATKTAVRHHHPRPRTTHCRPGTANRKRESSQGKRKGVDGLGGRVSPASGTKGRHGRVQSGRGKVSRPTAVRADL